MKQLAELIPLVLFFITYQMDGSTVQVGGWGMTVDGIFTATAVLIAATLVQVLLTWLLSRELERRLLWLLAAVCVFGGATLLLRDQTYIFWKPTVFNWGMALVFGASHFVGRRNVLERVMGGQVELPGRVWTRLLWFWVGHFTVVGALNLVVAYRFSEAFWVSYKLYTAFGFTLFLMAVTVAMIAPHLPRDHVPRGQAQAAPTPERET